MTGKDQFQKIIERQSEKCGFWHGVPHKDTVKKLHSYFGVKDDFELGLKFGSLCRFIQPEAHGMWQNPPIFDVLNGAPSITLDQGGVFEDCEDIRDIENYHWPNPEECDFSDTLKEIERTMAAGQAILSGTWGTFFRTTYCYFGMESCFIKMHESPELVNAVADRVVDFYLKANEKLYKLTGNKGGGNKIDALFFGNDFGTQLDLFISPKHFDRFVMPYFSRLTAQAHKYGIKVVLHSCGSIYRVIPRLIEAGVDVLHPIQAKAKNMDAQYLAENYKDKIIFMGGLDTQDILPFGTPREVKQEVRRLKETFGPNYILSPSHETLLPNVPVENVAAMVEAAWE